MARIQDLKHLEVVLDRYLKFQIDELEMTHIMKNVFKQYAVSENMRDNLTLEKYKLDKLKFKECLIIEKNDLTRKATNIGEEGFMAQMIYVKYANLIAKIIDSSVFSKH